MKGTIYSNFFWFKNCLTHEKLAQMIYKTGCKVCPVPSRDCPAIFPRNREACDEAIKHWFGEHYQDPTKRAED